MYLDNRPRFLPMLLFCLAIPALVLTSTALSAAQSGESKTHDYRLGYRSGYTDGYGDAYRSGYQEGHRDGYKLASEEKKN